jgi:hypothetical protein
MKCINSVSALTISAFLCSFGLVGCPENKIAAIEADSENDKNNCLEGECVGDGDSEETDSDSADSNQETNSDSTDSNQETDSETSDNADMDEEAFALYFLQDSSLDFSDLDASQLESLVLEDTPLLTSADMAHYNWQRHSFLLSDTSTVAFPKYDTGVPFVVTSKGQRLYIGALWSIISSLLPIREAVIYTDKYGEARTFVIEWNEPIGSNGPEDPRGPAVLKEALLQAGKLAGDPLPDSMKGYEMYSWQEADGEWKFTLITGTNRTKTCEEITKSENIEEDGWVLITDIGVEAFLKTLSRVAAEESLTWPNTRVDCPELALPPENIIEQISNHCLVLGIDFQRPLSN